MITKMQQDATHHHRGTRQHPHAAAALAEHERQQRYRLPSF
jgi:hypothetical protein